VDQVAPYGTDLHVIGRNGPALRDAAAEVAQITGCSLTEIETGLEDVFIQLMGVATDNMQ
jgi:ABC-2 type transport system ATP-binding protein